ncbi:MAG: hypothetical protein J6Z25_01635 [Opitutales bacterium]|nr:hypothetical protein [Opitutales bacterium]
MAHFLNLFNDKISCHPKVIFKIPALNWLAALRHYYVYGHPYDRIYVGEKIA